MTDRQKYAIYITLIFMCFSAFFAWCGMGFIAACLVVFSVIAAIVGFDFEIRIPNAQTTKE